MHQRIDHRLPFAPSVDYADDVVVRLWIGAATILLRFADARFLEFGHLVAQTAHRAAFQGKLLEIQHALDCAERRRGKGFSADRLHFFIIEDIELKVVCLAVPVHFLPESRQIILRAAIAVQQDNIFASPVVEVAPSCAADE